MEKIKLKMVGITYNQIESGVYAVILQREDGQTRIPIIIGYPEAQAIECRLQEILPPRPLTHDLTVNIMTSFGISLTEILIHKLPNGVFAAELTLSDGRREFKLDARSSDALALAIRVGAEIYTTADLLAEAGMEPGETPGSRRTPLSKTPSAPPVTFRQDLSLKSIDDLMADMQRAAENEDYEEAGRLKSEIERRRENQ